MDLPEPKGQEEKRECQYIWKEVFIICAFIHISNLNNSKLIHNNYMRWRYWTYKLVLSIE